MMSMGCEGRGGGEHRSTRSFYKVPWGGWREDEEGGGGEYRSTRSSYKVPRGGWRGNEDGRRMVDGGEERGGGRGRGFSPQIRMEMDAESGTAAYARAPRQ